MKSIIIALLIASTQAHGATTYQVNGKPISKVDAVKLLLSNPNAPVYAVNQVELSDKLALKHVKSVAKK